MKKKVLAMLMVGALALSMTACGSKSDDAAADSSTAAEEDSSKEEASSSSEEEADSSSTEESSSSSEEEAATTDLDYSSVKVAFVLPGSANDGSFNTKGYNAMLHLQELGCEATYSDNIGTEEQLDVLYEYADEGYNIIIGWGSQYDDDMATVADEYPDIQFVVASGTTGNDTNLTSTYIDGAHLGYGYGYMSALVTKSNKVAFIGANQGNQAYTDEVCGFIKGAKDCNSDVEVTILYVSDYSDVAEAKETAKLCVDNGCDVMFADISEGYYGMLEVAKENNVITFGRNATNIWGSDGISGTDDDDEGYAEGIIAYIENSWPIKMQDIVDNYLSTGEMLTGVTHCGFGTVVSGWTYNYDQPNGITFNPDIVTDEMAEQFEAAIDKIATDGWDYSFTADDANPGTY